MYQGTITEGWGVYHISGARIATLIDNRNVFLKLYHKSLHKINEMTKILSFFEMFPWGNYKAKP